jgi:HTH-type transcriptional regulator, quorum sensing regulator NprR
MVKAETAKRYENTRADLLGADVGRRIREARLERGMSLAQLGGNDLSRSFISLVELGRSRISLRALAILAERLDLPLSYFLDDVPGAGMRQGELALDRAEAALFRQDPRECLRLLDEVHPSATQRARALTLRGRALLADGSAREAIAVLQEGLSVAEGRGDAYAKVQIRYLLASALYSTRNYDESLVHYREALAEAVRDVEDPVLVGKITANIGHLLYVNGNVEGAIEHYDRARSLFGSVSDLEALASVYSGLSLAYERKGDPTSALHYSKLSLGAFEAKRNAQQAARELNNMAVRYQEIGQLDRALEHAQDAATRAREVNARDVEAAARSTVALIYLKCENFEAATAEAEAAESLATDDTDQSRIDAWLVLGDLAERNGDRERADMLYRRALDGLRQIGYEPGYADAAVAYSLILRQRGDTEGALHYALEAAQAKATRSA